MLLLIKHQLPSTEHLLCIVTFCSSSCCKINSRIHSCCPGMYFPFGQCVGSAEPGLPGLKWGWVVSSKVILGVYYQNKEHWYLAGKSWFYNFQPFERITNICILNTMLILSHHLLVTVWGFGWLNIPWILSCSLDPSPHPVDSSLSYAYCCT